MIAGNVLIVTKNVLKRNIHLMHQMWCFSMFDERKKSVPKTPLINKDYKSFDLDINTYFLERFYII